MSFSITTQMQRIAALHASGLNSAQISSVVGVSPSRISQIVATEEYKQLLESKRAETEKENLEEVAISAKYLSAEHALIDQVLQMAPSSELRDITAALRVVAERQERAATRKAPIHAAQVTNNQIIQLVLPPHALPELAISKTNEITAIANTSIAPLSSGGVTALFASLAAKKGNFNTEGNYNDSTGTIIEAERIPLTSTEKEVARSYG